MPPPPKKKKTLCTVKTFLIRSTVAVTIVGDWGSDEICFAYFEAAAMMGLFFGVS